MTLTEAKTYVSKIYGGSNKAELQTDAGESITATWEELCLRHDWKFLQVRQEITVLAGTARYTINESSSPDFSKPMSCRFTGTLKHPLKYKTQNELDALTWDQSVATTPVFYTIIDDDANFDPTTDVKKIQFGPGVPAANDTALLRYYRPLDASAATVDVPTRYLYTFLDKARVHFLRSKNATDSRLPMLHQLAEEGVRRAISFDLLEGGEDGFEGFVPSDRLNGSSSIIFYPRGDY
jgi:hypothetical protein